jgi:hypothetical protein
MRKAERARAGKRFRKIPPGLGTIEAVFGFLPQFMPRISSAASSCAGRQARVQGDFFRLGQDKIRKASVRKPATDTAKDQEMGSALRSVYQKTVDEAVPDDLLDLLGKLS